MRYWWVNQNQTYRHEVPGGYLWSPKRSANGARNPLFELVREVAPGDLLFVANAHGAIVHEAIYYGDGKIIESPRTGLPVRIVLLSTHTYVAARRVLPH